MIGEVSSVPALKEMGSDAAWWVRRNACFALANMGPEGETALLELLHSDDRYARDRAAATMEARGFTRRAVRNLSKPGRRGAKARDTVVTLIKVGAVRYLKDLAETLPDGDNRNVLREILQEHGVLPVPDAEALDGASPDAGAPDGEAPDEVSPQEGSGVPSGDAARTEG